MGAGMSSITDVRTAPMPSSVVTTKWKLIVIPNVGVTPSPIPFGSPHDPTVIA